MNQVRKHKNKVKISFIKRVSKKTSQTYEVCNSYNSATFLRKNFK